jgi:hypothetical protein
MVGRYLRFGAAAFVVGALITPVHSQPAPQTSRPAAGAKKHYLREALQAVAPRLARSLTTLPAVETALALSLLLTRALQTGAAQETDTARALSLPLNVRAASETDVALAPELRGRSVVELFVVEWSAATGPTASWSRGPAPSAESWLATSEPTATAWNKS